MKINLIILILSPITIVSGCKKVLREDSNSLAYEKSLLQSSRTESGTLQSAPAAEVVGRYNGPANKFDAGRAMTVDALGNIYVSGTSEGKKGNRDYVTIKYSATGVEQWVARYNGTGNGEDYPYAITVDSDGNVYVTGRSIGIGSNHDYATVRYNAENGAQEWVMRHNSSTNMHDLAKDVKVENGFVYVTGYTNGSSTGSGTAITTIKYRADNGAQEWVKNYPETGSVASSDANSVAIDAEGNVYITGKSTSMATIKYSSAGSFQWERNCGGDNGRKIKIDLSGSIISTGWGSKTVKYSPDGTQLWEAPGPVSGTAFQDLAVDAAGNVYVTGYGRPSTTKDDFITVKYNTDGVQQWWESYNFSFNGIDLARSIALDGTGNVYVTGRAEVYDGSRNGTVNYGIVKYDATGVRQWVALYDGPDKQSSESFAIATDALGKVYVTGQSAYKTSYFDIVTIKY